MKDPQGPNRIERKALDAALVVLLAVAGHAAALHGSELTVDDEQLVEHDPRLTVRSVADAWTLVSTSYWGEAYRAERLWRPVVQVSFALDRALFGPSPDAYHAVTVGLHAATSVLALLLFGRLLPSRRAALAGALVFALHPVHAEATAGVVGRAEVLALLLALAGTLAHLRARAAGARLGWLLPAALFLLAFGSKEVALTAPFVLAVVERVVGLPAPRSRAAVVAPYALYGVVIALYLAARWAVLGGLAPPPEAQSIGVLPLHVRLLVAAGTAREAIRALLAPGPAAAVFPFTPPSWTDGNALLALGVNAMFVGLSLLALRRRERALRAAGLGGLAFYLTLGPSMNLVPIGVVFADRLVYTPSLWGILALTAGAHLVLRGRPAAWTLVLALVLAPCAVGLSRRAHAWSHEVALWRSTVARFGQDPGARYGLGSVLLNELDRVDRLLRPSVLAEAREHLEAAVAGPAHAKYAAPARAALASLLHAQGDAARAVALLEQALALDPGNARALLELVRVRLDQAERARDEAARDHALALADRASRAGVRAAPHSYELWLLHGLVQQRRGRGQEAEAAYDQAVRRRPGPWQAHVNRGLVREGRGARQAALEDYRAAAAILAARPRRTAEEEWFVGEVARLRAALGDR